MTCDVCGSPGEVRHYPGPVPISARWCPECYARERELYREWRERNPFKKPYGTVPFLTREKVLA